MAQAKTLDDKQLRRVQDYIATRPHAIRNRTMLAVSHLAMLRVGEIAALRYCDVLARDGSIKSEVHLSAEQTKGKHGRTIYINSRLQKQLAEYVAVYKPTNLEFKLFYTQKRRREGFSANSLAQYFMYMYRNAGIDGASSHSGRRTGATKIYSSGASLKVVMQILGHRNLATTSRYLHVTPDMINKAIELA